MSLAHDEIELVGGWIKKDGRMIADDVCRRIETLIGSELLRVANSRSGWEMLYRDPQDGRFWELYYPLGEMHGGGPPALRVLDRNEVHQKYGLEIQNVRFFEH